MLECGEVWKGVFGSVWVWETVFGCVLGCVWVCVRMCKGVERCARVCVRVCVTQQYLLKEFPVEVGQICVDFLPVNVRSR